MILRGPYLPLLFLTGVLSAAPLFAGELVRFTDKVQTPPMVAPDLAGRQHSLEDYRGKVILLNFWASWCQPCLKEMPSMQRLQQQMAGRPFTILAVDIRESKSTVWRFRELLNITFTTLLDRKGDIARAWNIDIYPTSFLLDTEGRIRYGVKGALEWDEESSIRVIESMLPDRRTVARSAKALKQRQNH